MVNLPNNKKISTMCITYGEYVNVKKNRTEKETMQCNIALANL